MDTETATSGFTRSIVMKAGLASRDVLAGAAGSASSRRGRGVEAFIPLEPTLIGTELELGTPDIKRLPSAGTKGHVDVAFKIKDRKALPTGVQASVRWDPIDVAVAPADPANEVDGAASQGAPAAPAAAAGSEAQPPAATTEPAAAPAAAASAEPAPAKAPHEPRPRPSPSRPSPRRRRKPRARRHG